VLTIHRRRKKRRSHIRRKLAKSIGFAIPSGIPITLTLGQLRISKNDTIRELALYLSHDLSLPTSPIAGALPEIQARLKDNLSVLHFLPEDASPVPGIIKFKRHVQARWDQPTKRFIPLDEPKWVWENTLLMIVDAGDIVDRVESGYEGLGLGNWFGDIRLSLGLGVGGTQGRGSKEESMVLVIKGMGKYYAKMSSVANREYTAAARAGLGEGALNTGTGSKSGGKASGPEKQDVEKALVELQLSQGCFIVHGELSSVPPE
jgi:crossover junction endonuclease EME1